MGHNFRICCLTRDYPKMSLKISSSYNPPTMIIFYNINNKPFVHILVISVEVLEGAALKLWSPSVFKLRAFIIFVKKPNINKKEKFAG